MRCTMIIIIIFILIFIISCSISFQWRYAARLLPSSPSV